MLIALPVAYNVLFTMLARTFDYPDILRRPTIEVLERFSAGGSRLVLAPLFVLGSMEFVGSNEVEGWKFAGMVVPIVYIGWSLWLHALGIALLI